MSSLPLLEPAVLPAAVDSIVFDEKTIALRVKQLAGRIERDFHNLDLVVVGILQGAFLFACDLVREVDAPLTLDFLSISRYRPSTRKGSPAVRILKDLEEDIRGRHVLLLEDIVDTGLTLHYLVQALASREPASLSVCTLLDRPDLRLAEIPIRYRGFEVNQQFLIGYGLDYRGHFRELPYIATMKV